MMLSSHLGAIGISQVLIVQHLCKLAEIFLEV